MKTVLESLTEEFMKRNSAISVEKVFMRMNHYKLARWKIENFEENNYTVSLESFTSKLFRSSIQGVGLLTGDKILVYSLVIIVSFKINKKSCVFLIIYYATSRRLNNLDVGNVLIVIRGFEDNLCV